MQLTPLEKRCMGPIPTVTGGAFYEPVSEVVKELKAKGAPAKFIKEIIDDAKRQAEASRDFASYKGPILKAKLVSSEMIPQLSLEDALRILWESSFNLGDKVKIGFDSQNMKYLPTPYVIGPVNGRLDWKQEQKGIGVFTSRVNCSGKKYVELQTASKELYPGVTRVLVYPTDGTTPALGYAFHLHTTSGRMPKEIDYKKASLKVQKSKSGKKYTFSCSLSR